jgi:dipeptidyl aminopeptidase/acylaminoacyl peptidase
MATITVDSQPTVTRDDYARAEQWLAWNAYHLIFDAEVIPNWIDGGDRFWYRARRPSGITFMLVDPELGAREAFDQVRLAASLSSATGVPYLHTDLPFRAIEFVDGGTAVRFAVGDAWWQCDLETYECIHVEVVPGPMPAEGELPSPDFKWGAFARDHNLFIRPMGGGEERQLTTDGEPYYAYGAHVEGWGLSMADKLFGSRYPPVALWSPDSRYLLTYRLDERRVEPLHWQQTIVPEGEYRPVLHSFRNVLVGEKETPLAELVVIDVAAGRVTPVDHPPLLAAYISPFQLQLVWWDADSRHIHFIDEERGYHTVRLITADAETGVTRKRLSESSPTFVQVRPGVFNDPLSVRVLSEDRGIIWYSCRDGWGHLYLFDAVTGDLKHQITSGAWVVRQIVRVDEEHGWIYFLAGGREEGRDPYLRHLYRVALSGTDLTLLTPEDADHEVAFSPSGRVFVDTFSRVDLVPRSVLRSADGRLLAELEEGDISQLLARGWRLPEPFSVKARDGVTDIYGVIVRPTNFDPNRSYPVLDSIYPGPQIIRTPKRFSGGPESMLPDLGWLWHEQALAELGFIVITVEGQGTPYRSKPFIDKMYGENFGEAGGLEDHIAAIRQLAGRDPSFDIDRVGIFGHSAGGYASARAILKFPDFFKVAVSSAGNHDQRGYTSVWGERFIGMPEGDNYRDQSNYPLAPNLTGKLLLAYGALDDSVPPALILRLVDALIRANKDFELLVLPHCEHAFVDLRLGSAGYYGVLRNGIQHRYFIRRRWDFFVRHLLGAEPPQGCVIA